MSVRVVEPRDFVGWNQSLFQMFGKGPKFTVKCGGCPGTFEVRIPQIDNPTVRCPHCGAFNRMPLEWVAA